MPPSLWAATARPAPSTPAIDGNHDTDVAVVGAGYAGLSSALHLAQANVDVTVLEANEVGWGASGRSGGQVIPGIKYDPEEMYQLFGESAGKRAADTFGSTAQRVFDVIDRFDIECEAKHQGWLQPAHSKAAERAALDRCRQWRELHADVEALSEAEVADLLGSSAYYAGWIDRRGGSVQPLSYTRGLADAAMSMGARVAGQSRVSQIERDGTGWTLFTKGGGKISARRVLLCTNGYSDALWPGLRKTVIAANSFQIATDPLPQAKLDQILKGGIVASDTRRLLAYWRRDDTGRLILGGRGTFDEPDSKNDFGHLERMVARIYPGLAHRPIEYRWGGRIAITQDFLPHVHRPEKGLHILIGCQGRGIALQTSMGQWMAQYLVTGEREMLPVPITPVRRIPLHGLRRFYVAATLAYYKARDLF